MIKINELIKEGNIALTVGLNDLKEFAKDIIQQTKKELEDSILAQKLETFVSTQKACEILDVDSVTLWRWHKRNYLVPATVGGKKRYKMSDINKMLNVKN